MAKKIKVYNIDEEIEIKDKNKTTLLKFKELRISPLYARLMLMLRAQEAKTFLNNITIEAVDQDGNLILEGLSGSSSYENGINKYINLESRKRFISKWR
mgnify:CR=1 FL=1